MSINRHFYYFIVLCLVLNIITGCQSNQVKTPNIILILADDLGWKDPGFMGNGFYETPHLDRIASEGMIFINAYSPSSNCTPSRAAILTGLYAPRTGIYTVNSSSRGNSKFRQLVPVENVTELSTDFTTIAEVLRETGYQTIHIGKWHLGESPLDHGFESNIGGGREGMPGSYVSPYKLAKMPDDRPGRYLTDHLTDEALKFIKTPRQQPFFMNLAYYTVHVPLQAKKGKSDYYQNKMINIPSKHNPEYAGMVSSLDENIGRLIMTLDSLNQLENTLIIFTSDNGGMFKYTDLKPFRAGKGAYYEGGIRVPLIAYWPSQIEKAQVNSTPVTGIDFFPTLLDAAQIPQKQALQLDGVSLLPLFRQNGDLPQRSIFWHFPIYLQSGYLENRDVLFRTRPGSAILSGNWKLHQYYEDNSFELFNLTNDPGEKINLVDQNPDVFLSLHNQLQEWLQTVNAPIPLERNPEYNPELDNLFREQRMEYLKNL